MNNGSKLKPSLKIRELLIKGYEKLREQDIVSYQIDSQLLLAKVLKKDRLFVLVNGDMKVDSKCAEEYAKLIDKRSRKVPVKYMLGECEFMGINFAIREGVLIPRPDTETLVECLLGEINKTDYKVVCDVCCGSGIIGLSIAKLASQCEVECCDISDIACSVTYENIEKLNLKDRVSVYKSSTLEYAVNNDKEFDIIVSNPPYIRADMIEELMEDVKNYEPYEALCGGEDGLDFYRKITLESTKVLRRGGILAFEIGDDQREEVFNILEQNNFLQICCKKDMSYKDRVVMGKLI